MTRTDKWIRALVALVVVGLGLVAAVVSFQHGLEVVQDHGQSGLTAILSPLTVDGLVLAAGLVMLDSARRGERPPVLAIVTLALGIGATLGINVLFGWPYGIVGAIVAGWPAVALVLTTELLMGLIRRGQSAGASKDAVAVDLHRVREITQTLATDANASPVEVFTGPGLVEVEPVAVEAEQLAIAPESDPDPLVPTARERFAEGLARGDLPSVKQVRTELRVGWPRAKQILAALATS